MHIPLFTLYFCQIAQLFADHGSGLFKIRSIMAISVVLSHLSSSKLPHFLTSSLPHFQTPTPHLLPFSKKDFGVYLEFTFGATSWLRWSAARFI